MSKQTDKYLIGIFDDEEVLLKAVKNVRKADHKIYDVFTPFPVHGLEHALGYRDSQLHMLGFFAGAIGLTLMLSFITWITVSDYPTIYGGKPFFSLPAYIPISFEFTVLSASVTMVVAYFIRNGLKPAGYPRIFDARSTDDKFVMAFEINEDTKEDDLEAIRTTLTDNGAEEIKIRDFSEEPH